MSIRKTGIALWRGSGFSLRTLKKENDVLELTHESETKKKTRSFS